MPDIPTVLFEIIDGCIFPVAFFNGLQVVIQNIGNAAGDDVWGNQFRRGHQGIHRDLFSYVYF